MLFQGKSCRVQYMNGKIENINRAALTRVDNLLINQSTESTDLLREFLSTVRFLLMVFKPAFKPELKQVKKDIFLCTCKFHKKHRFYRFIGKICIDIRYWFHGFSKNRNFVTTTFLFKKIMEHTIQSFSEDQLIYSTCFKI